MNFYFFIVRDSFSFIVVGRCGLRWPTQSSGTYLCRLAALDTNNFSRRNYPTCLTGITHLRCIRRVICNMRAYKPSNDRVDDDDEMKRWEMYIAAAEAVDGVFIILCFFSSSSSIFPITFNLRLGRLDTYKAFPSLLSRAHFPKCDCVCRSVGRFAHLVRLASIIESSTWCLNDSYAVSSGQHTLHLSRDYFSFFFKFQSLHARRDHCHRSIISMLCAGKLN